MDQDYFGKTNKYVNEISHKDFDKLRSGYLKKPISGLVLFYAPWCGYCKAMKDEYEKAAKKIGFCDLCAFNCEKYKTYTKKIKNDMPSLIHGYPTIIIYKNGKPVEKYNGGRSSEDFIKCCMEICKT